VAPLNFEELEIELRAALHAVRQADKAEKQKGFGPKLVQNKH